MKRIDASPQGIFEISWSSDSKWLTYVLGSEVRLASAETGEIRVIGQGTCPNVTTDLRVIMEQEDEIVVVSGSGTDKLAGRKDIVKDTPKRSPVVSPDAERVLFSVCNVFDKTSQTLNAFPYRHFLAVGPIGRGKATLTREQWYGGAAVWFPDGKKFAHFEFDSTAGPQIHVVSSSGDREGTVAGLYPSISPDGTRMAVRPRGGGSLVVYFSKGSWTDDEITTTVLPVPTGESTRPSATPPVWLDNRLVLVCENSSIFRLDTKREKAEEMKKLPLPTERRKPSMVASPDREMIAVEVVTDAGFELCVFRPSA